jgi:hypothetical protein
MATSKAEIVKEYQEQIPNDIIFPGRVVQDRKGRDYNPGRYNWLIENVDAAAKAAENLTSDRFENPPDDERGRPGPAPTPAPPPAAPQPPLSGSPLRTASGGPNDDVLLLYAAGAVLLVLFLSSAL